MRDRMIYLTVTLTTLAYLLYPSPAEGQEHEFGLALEASAQIPEGELTQPEARLTIPVKWGPVGNWGTDPGRPSGGRLHADEKAVYILGAWRTQKGEEGPWRFVRAVRALTKESGALKWTFEIAEGASNDFNLGPPRRRTWYRDGTKFEHFDFYFPSRAKWTPPPMPVVRAVSSDGFVYFQVGDALHALDQETGVEKWRSEAPQITRRFPLLSRVLEICIAAAIALAIGRLLKLSNRVKVIIFVVGVLAITVIEAPRRLAALSQTTHPHLADLRIADGSVYFRSSSGLLYALAGATGELEWRSDPVSSWGGLFRSVLRSFGFRRELPNIPAPAISEGVIIAQHRIRGEASRLAGFDAETGKILWISKAQVMAGEPPIAAAGIIYAPTNDSVVALAAETGILQWQSDKIEMSDRVIPEGPALYEFFDGNEQLERVSFKVRASDPTHLLALEDELLYVLTSASGEVEWSSEYAAGSHDAVGHAVLALSASTGEIRWKKHIIGRNVRGAIVAARGVLLYQGAETLYALSAETGETQWQFEGGSLPYGCELIVQGNTVYVPCAKERLLDTGSHISEDRLYALELGTGEVKWRSPDPLKRVRGDNYILEIDDYAIAPDGTAYIGTDRFVFALDHM